MNNVGYRHIVYIMEFIEPVGLEVSPWISVTIFLKNKFT